MRRRFVHVEHYGVDYELARNSVGWTVWESRGGDQDREVATFPQPDEPGQDALIQRATDAIDAAAEVLVAGTRVRVGDLDATLIDVNVQGLVEFTDGDIGWYPLVRIRAA